MNRHMITVINESGEVVYPNDFHHLVGEGDVPLFQSIDTARNIFLKEGYTREEIGKWRYLRRLGVCRKCGHPLFKSLIPLESGSEDIYGDGYEYRFQCFYCEDDFYSFEQPAVSDGEDPEHPPFGYLTREDMKIGDYVDTPRFLTVQLERVFPSVDAAMAAGYTETTHYQGADWAILGKPIDLYHTTFAAAAK